MTTLIPMPLVVFSGAQENANNGMGISVVICDFKVVSEFFVIHTRDVSFYFNFTNRFARFYGHLKVKLEVFKESFQFAFNFHFCQVNSREADFFFSIGRQRVFVVFENIIHVLVQTEKGRISSSCFEMFHHTRRKIEYTLRVRLASKKNMCFIMESTIVICIWTVKRRFNNISKVVDAMCISNINVRSIGSSDVPVVNSILDTRLVDDHVSNADDALNVRKFHVIRTRGEFATVSVCCMRGKSFCNRSIPVKLFNHVQSIG